MKNLPATELLDQRLDFLKRLPDQVRTEFVKYANFNGFPYDEFTRKWLEFVEYRYDIKLTVQDDHRISLKIGDKIPKTYESFEDAFREVKFQIMDSYCHGPSGWFIVEYKSPLGEIKKKPIFAQSEKDAFNTIQIVFGDVISVTPQHAPSI